jgi:microcystin-dependent protein
MAQVFLGSLMLVPYNFAPLGWAFCQGQLLSISQNTALFSLLGTQYGGDGKSTFALPDLRGNLVVSQGQGPGLSSYDIGQSGGSPFVTLTAAETPNHGHTMHGAKGGASQPAPAGAGLADAAIYSNATAPLTQLNQQALTTMGSNQPHNNMMPFQGLNWIIALRGIFPSRS